MPDDATILARFATAGDQEFIQMFQQIASSMKATESVSDELRKRLDTMLDAGTIKAREHFEMMSQIPTVVKNLSAAEQQRVKVLNDLASATEKNNADMSKQDAQMAKIAQRTQELNSTALGRFNASIYGGVVALEKMETSAYQASRNATVLMRSFVMAPISTMKQFAASTEKAAIASQFLKEQLSFVLASRFGTIALGFAIFGTAGKLVRDTVSAMIDLDKQTKIVESGFSSLEKTMSTHADIQSRLITGSMQFGQSYEDIAKILWELKTAGLSAEDAMAGLQTNQQLVVGGASDIAQATRLTAGVFRNFADQIDSTAGAQEKFRRIGEVMAAVVYETQGNMDDLVQAMKYVLPTADLAGIKFDVLAALIGLANDKMLFGSKAGTSLNNAFLQMIKNLNDVVKHYDLVIDSSKSLGEQLPSIIQQMQQHFKGTALSMEELNKLFDDFNIRGSRGWAAVITAGERGKQLFKETADAIQGNTNRLKELTDTRLDTMASQWDRLGKSITGALISWGNVSPFKWMAKTIADASELWARIEDITKACGLMGVAINTAFKSNLARIFKGDIVEALNVLQKFPDEIRIAYKTPGLIEGVENSEELIAILKDMQSIKLSINDKYIYTAFRKLNIEATTLMNLFKQYPSTMRVIFNTPGLKESIKDTQDLLNLVDELNQRGSVQLLISPEDQARWKKLFEDAANQSSVISGENQKQALSLKQILMEQGDYNTLLALGLASQSEITNRIRDRIAEVKKDIVANQDNAEKVKELTQELGKLLGEQQSFNRETTKTKGILDKITVIEMNFRGPVRDIKVMNQELINALNNLKAATKDSDDWNTQINAVMKAYTKVADAQKVINQAIIQAVGEYGKIQSITAGLVSEYMKLGQTQEAVWAAQKGVSMANEAARWLETEMEATGNTQDRLELEKQLVSAIDQQIAAQNELRQIGVGSSAAITQDIISLREKQLRLTQDIIQEQRTQVEEAQNELLPLQNTKAKAEEILRQFVGWTPAIRDATSQLSQMSVILGGVAQKAGNIGFIQKITPKVDTSGFEKANQLAEETKATLGQWQIPLDQIKVNTNTLANNFSNVKSAIDATTQGMQILTQGSSLLPKNITTLDEKFNQVQASLGDSATAMQVLQGGMLKTIKFANDGTEEFKKWEDAPEDATKSFRVLSDNMDDIATASNAVNQILNSMNAPAREIEINSQSIRQSLEQWSPPIIESGNGITGMRDNLSDVNRAIDSITANLSNLASRIRSMPKLDIGGGGGGGISSNELLTNPEYQ